MRVPYIVRIVGTGIVGGVLAFLATGAFHWAYLVALGVVLWMFGRAEDEPSRPASLAGKVKPGPDSAARRAGRPSREAQARATGPPLFLTRPPGRGFSGRGSPVDEGRIPSR